LTQADPQAEYGALQLIPQEVPLQLADPLAGTGHAVHDVVPHEEVDELLEQVPLQSWLPLVHAQWPD
jgi:hypothetical protein